MREEVNYTLSSLRFFLYFVSYFVFKDKERTYVQISLQMLLNQKAKTKKRLFLKF